MYVVKFMFDYCADSCLWGTEGEGLLPLERFPISEALMEKLESLSIEYNSILNWDDPASGFVWTMQQIENFRARAQDAYRVLVNELGEEYEVRNCIDMCLGIKPTTQ